MGYGAKFHPQPVDGDDSADALAADNGGDEKCIGIPENMKLSCALKTEKKVILNHYMMMVPLEIIQVMKIQV